MSLAALGTGNPSKGESVSLPGGSHDELRTLRRVTNIFRDTEELLARVALFSPFFGTFGTSTQATARRPASVSALRLSASRSRRVAQHAGGKIKDAVYQELREQAYLFRRAVLLE